MQLSVARPPSISEADSKDRLTRKFLKELRSRTGNSTRDESSIKKVVRLLAAGLRYQHATVTRRSMKHAALKHVLWIVLATDWIVGAERAQLQGNPNKL